jgi:paired small multidrug resistance pump
MEPRQAPALLMNLAGAGLILVSLAFSFNLSAFLMEAAWALVALFGLARLWLKR